MNISNLIEDVGNRSNDVMKLIGRIKNNDKRLKKVDLEKKRIHWSDTEDLAPALATNNVVTHVTLAGCGIGKPVMLLLIRREQSSLWNFCGKMKQSSA
jgi:hypothetical protein